MACANSLLADIHDLLRLQAVQHILHVHPNDPLADYASQCPEAVLANIAVCQIPRDPIGLIVDIPQPSVGMSPKKYHEVSRMTQYIANLVKIHQLSNFHIVDVGAGQGYLTRALYRHFASPTLALDSDIVQTHGSLARSGQSMEGITHRTIHLSPDSLIQAVDDWIPSSATDTPVPVLFVALHACGTLTPDLFRAILSLCPQSRPWCPALVVAVGCCYNLMSPATDFPLSCYLRTHCNPLPRPLPVSAYQIAAQIPNTWSLNERAKAEAEFALKKVVWRAMLGRLYTLIMERSEETQSNEKITGTGSSPTMRRLGRLNDSAYTSWEHFLSVASQRISVDFLAFPGALDFLSLASPDTPSESSAQPIPLTSRLTSLHFLRCLLGPVIESYIILDRVQWLQEQLDSRQSKTGDWLRGCTIDTVNLFDQATGSGRNIALVLAPSLHQAHRH